MNARDLWATLAIAFAITTAAAVTQLSMQPEPETKTIVQTQVVEKPVVETIHVPVVKTEIKEVIKTEIKEVEVPVIEYVTEYVTDEAAMNDTYITGYEDGRIEGEDWQHSLFDRALTTPCAEEDSDNCYWNASLQGNGEGSSFVVVNGTTYYLD